MIYHSKALIELDIKIFFSKFLGPFWRKYKGSKIDGVDNRNRKIMVEREEKWLTGEIGGREAKFFSVSDHAGQTGEELRAEFCIREKFCGGISWILLWIRSRSMLLLQFLLHFRFFKLEANLLRVLKFRMLKQIRFELLNYESWSKFASSFEIWTWSKFASTFEILIFGAKMLQFWKFWFLKQNCFNFLKFF